MELERRDIERTDFPQARRGYDTGEVDRHLRAIAAAVEELKSTRAQSAPSLAGAAAERVEAIVAAAEASARDIEERAQADAQATVANAEEMVAALVARAQELKTEVDEFVGRVVGLKAAVDTMHTDLAASVPGAVEPAPALASPEPVPAPAAVAAPEPEPEPVALAAVPDPEPEPEPEPAAAPPAEPEPEAEAPAEPKRSGGGASEGARLIALNMALSGTPREETARYLRENFDLDDQDNLLDDVYARAGS